MRAIGSSLPRVDAAEKVAGTALYPGDIDLPGQVWAKIVFAGVPHARIKDVQTAEAAIAPGVITILTAQDVPINEYGLIMPDQPVLCGLRSTEQAQTVRWEADQVAVVIAETAEQAAAAAQLVQIDYESLPVVNNPVAALAPDAPILHPYPFSTYPYGERDITSNVLLSYRIQHGDIKEGFAQSDVIVESTYRTHAQEHAYLQPEAGLAQVLPDGRIEVICAGQWMHEDREQIAHALGVPVEKIVVRYPAIGGAFGGREDLSIQIVLALAAWKTGRPAKIVWSREESIVGHHKRHPYLIRAKWGATRTGQIVAAQMDVTSDAGAYAYTSTKVLGNAVLACLGPYAVPHVLVEGRTVYTNNCPGGAFRGFGGPQGHFAAEMQVNKLAVALDMDPVELRMRNIWRDGSVLATQSVVPAGCTAEPVLAAAAERGGWRQGPAGWRHGEPSASAIAAQSYEMSTGADDSQTLTSLVAGQKELATGHGVALCFKNVGFSLGAPESCVAWVELHGGASIERADVGCVGADVGQGAHTVFRQIAADVLSLDPDQVQLRAESTDVAGSSGSSSASRMTFMAGNAIRGAAETALRAWHNEERPARADYVFRPRSTTGYAPGSGKADPNITYGYCAQVAEVSVDMDTGFVTVRRVISANDVGRAINPQQVEGQIEGAIAQSLGWTLVENFVQRDGLTLTSHLSTYLIPGVWDVAEVIEPVILEIPDPQSPLGARGMAEMPFIPTAPAIATAVFHAAGVWIDELPLTPDRVWKACQVAKTVAS